MIENQLAHSQLDLFKKAGRFNAWKPDTIEMDIKDGVLNIQLNASEGEAILSYVVVKNAGAVDEPSTVRAGSLKAGFLLMVIALTLFSVAGIAGLNHRKRK